MTISYVYEPAFKIKGWFASELVIEGWFDMDWTAGAAAATVTTEPGLHAISVGRVGSQQGLCGIELGLLN